MLTLALIFGGRSAEHEISLSSAQAVLRALDPAKYHVMPVGITRAGVWVRPLDVEAALRDGLEASPSEPVALLPDPSRRGLLVGDAGEIVPLDFAFPILHGPFGEDGTIQGLFELADLPYAGAGVVGSAVGMDKDLMKAAFASAGLPQPAYLVLRSGGGDAAVAAVEETFRYPVFVKPANMGSSVGISKAHDRDELLRALELALLYDRKVIVEEFVDAREIECGVIGNDDPQVSVPGEVLPANEFYDFESKYTDGMMAFAIPAPIDARRQAELQDLAAAAFLALDCAGFARCDFFLERATGRLLLNEINTIPGMTAMSGFPKFWEATGVPYPQLVDRIVDLGLERHAARARLVTSREIRPVGGSASD